MKKLSNNNVKLNSLIVSLVFAISLLFFKPVLAFDDVLHNEESKVGFSEPISDDMLIDSLPEKELNLYDIHTKKSLKIVFWKNGAYIEDALLELNEFLRDRRNKAVTRMDPELFMLIHRIYEEVKGTKPIHVISAYRSKKSNDSMRSSGRKVAKKSQHIEGKAMDIRIPGVPLKKLRDTALKMGVGGVGFYRASNFVHIDTGRPRTW